MAGPGQGITGNGGSRRMDKGTLALTTNVHPRNLGVAPLAANQPFVPEPDKYAIFRCTIREALRRGAKDDDLKTLRRKFLWMRHMQSINKVVGESGISPLAPAFGDEHADEDWTKTAIHEESVKFGSLIDAEMLRISRGVQTFQDVPRVSTRGPVSNKDEYRYKIRPLYYAYGYTKPADFLSIQVRFSLLAKTPFTWVHPDLAATLSKTADVLNGWSKGLAQRVAAQLQDVQGLEMREIKGKEALSNHAFGCAIDVNAYGSPHVVGPAIIEVFNWAANHYGALPFDFGKPILKDLERRHQYKTEEVEELYSLARPASEAVREWLRDYLPKFHEVMERVEIAANKLGLTFDPKKRGFIFVNWDTPYGKRLRIAEERRNRLRTQRLQKAVPSRTDAGTDAGSEPPSEEGPEDVALAEFYNAYSEISSDPDLSRIEIISENYEPKYLETWIQEGILGVPQSLAAALVGELHLRWGEQYETTKDAMHFEIFDGVDAQGREIPHVKPDEPRADHEPPRKLERLLDEVFQSNMPPRFLIPKLEFHRAPKSSHHIL